MVISPSEYIKKCLKIDFDNSVENIIDTGASIIIFEKGTMPIEMGEMINCFYFIIYGLVRGYYIDDDGNEVTKCFVYENGFFGSECYRTKDTSTFFVDCLEECKCIKLPYFLIQKIMSYTVDSEYLYKTGANLYDRNRFAPVFISLHSYQASGSSPAGLVTRGAGHPESCGRYHPDVSGSR